MEFVTNKKSKGRLLHLYHTHVSSRYLRTSRSKTIWYHFYQIILQRRGEKIKIKKGESFFFRYNM